MTYRNLRNEVKTYTINITKVYEYHIAGVDTANNRHKTFRRDQILEYSDNFKEVLDRFEVEPSKLVARKPRGTTGTGKQYNPDQLMEVCFTGFRKADKERLIALAEESKLYVTSRVTLNLGILVCGYNAGPKKIEDAIKSANKVEIMEEDEFLHFLETGEVKG